MFIRAWSAYPSMSVRTGTQTGGVVGTLKTLGRLTRELGPKQIYVVWESGGSAQRRKIFPEYKLGRRPEKLNRFYEDDIPDTDENRRHQMLVLVTAMKCLPVCQLYVPDCEADDVIAYLCKSRLKDENKVIVSNDRDMYQFLDEKTTIYNLHKKSIVTESHVLDEFRILSSNFALAKCIIGDPSDNIPGIKGVGYKTLVKNIPLVSAERDVHLSDVIAFCEAHRDENKVCRKIAEGSEVLKRNWKLIYLDASTLSSYQAQKVEGRIDSFVPRVDRHELMKLLNKEGIVDVDVAGLVYSLNCIEGLGGEH